MIPVGGRPMVSLVIDALLGAKSISEVTVIGAAPNSERCRVVDDHGGFMENIYAGMEATSGSETLITTADIPFLTPESVDNFIATARAAGGDVVYPIVRVEDCYAKYPDVKRTAVRLREGSFTGGNMMLVKRDFMDAQRERIARAYNLRKSPLRLALMLGVGVTLKLVASVALKKPLLSIPQLESAASRLAGGGARAVISRFPEIATDIDRASDLAAVGVVLRADLAPECGLFVADDEQVRAGEPHHQIDRERNRQRHQQLAHDHRHHAEIHGLRTYRYSPRTTRCRGGSSGDNVPRPMVAKSTMHATSSAAPSAINP